MRLTLETPLIPTLSQMRGSHRSQIELSCCLMGKHGIETTWHPIEIARRKKGVGKKKVQLNPLKCRDKTQPTPKRPRHKTRRRERVEISRLIKTGGFGPSPIVANPAETRDYPTSGASAHSMLTDVSLFKLTPI